MNGYTTTAAQQAYEWKGKRYADYIERHNLALAAKMPERAEEFKTQTIGAALAGNNGN